MTRPQPIPVESTATSAALPALHGSRPTFAERRARLPRLKVPQGAPTGYHQGAPVGRAAGGAGRHCHVTVAPPPARSATRSGRSIARRPPRGATRGALFDQRAAYSAVSGPVRSAQRLKSGPQIVDGQREVEFGRQLARPLRAAQPLLPSSVDIVT